MNEIPRFNLLLKWFVAQFHYPFLCLMILIEASPMTVMNGFSFFPCFSFMVLYYLSVNHPKNINILILFILASFKDIVTGEYIGVTAFAWLIVERISLRHRHLYQVDGRIDGWLAFMVICALYLLMLWVLHGLADFRFIFSASILFSWGSTVALYPWFSSLLSALDRRISQYIWSS